MADQSSGKKLYYRIGEVCQRLDLEPHTLRSWEVEFPALKPRKNRAGHRIFTEKDIALIGKIKDLIYRDGFTLAGAKKRLLKTTSDESGDVSIQKPTDPAKVKEAISEVRKILKTARKLLEPEG